MTTAERDAYALAILVRLARIRELERAQRRTTHWEAPCFGAWRREAEYLRELLWALSTCSPLFLAINRSHFRQFRNDPALDTLGADHD
jgi:hypothetical protein